MTDTKSVQEKAESVAKAKPKAEPKPKVTKSEPNKPPAKTWRGLPLYDCPNCAFSTLDKDSYNEHMKRYGGGK